MSEFRDLGFQLFSFILRFRLRLIYPINDPVNFRCETCQVSFADAQLDFSSPKLILDQFDLRLPCLLDLCKARLRALSDSSFSWSLKLARSVFLLCSVCSEHSTSRSAASHTRSLTDLSPLTAFRKTSACVRILGRHVLAIRAG